VLGGAAFLVFLPQLLVWHYYFGEPRSPLVPVQYMRWSAPAIVGMLFSMRGGLLAWSPVVYLSLAGLGLERRRLAALGAATVGRARARPGRTLRARALCQRQRLGLVVELVLRRAALLQPRGRVRAGVGRPMATPRNEAVRAPAACARDRSARAWQRRHDG